MERWEYLECVVDYHGTGSWWDSVGRSGELAEGQSGYHAGPLLNALGAQGWELVGIQVLPRGDHYTSQARWLFKRTTESNRP